MKRIFSLLLACLLLLTACGQTAENASAGSSVESVIQQTEEEEETEEEYLSRTAADFTGLNDPRLLDLTKDTVYSELVSSFNNENYIIEDISTVWISKEYIEELEYNSKSNVFFGYTLAELDAQFQGAKYVFTLGDNGQTTVKPFEGYRDDTYKKVIKDVAIGSGVILLCVTVSIVTGGIGAPATISTIVACSAQGAVSCAMNGAVIGAISAAITESIQTGSIDEATLKAAALGAGEGFKWGAVSGAVTGAITGGIKEATAAYKAYKVSQTLKGAEYVSKGTVNIADDLPYWRQSELRALNQSGGFEQLSFLDGKQVPFNTANATRPDITIQYADHLMGVEVKNYNLASPSCRNGLYKELLREIPQRIENMPKGSTQKIILDVTGRGFSESLCNKVVDKIHLLFEDIYPNIPVEIMGLG